MDRDLHLTNAAFDGCRIERVLWILIMVVASALRIAQPTGFYTTSLYLVIFRFFAREIYELT